MKKPGLITKSWQINCKSIPTTNIPNIQVYFENKCKGTRINCASYAHHVTKIREKVPLYTKLDSHVSKNVPLTNSVKVTPLHFGVG